MNLFLSKILPNSKLKHLEQIVQLINAEEENLLKLSIEDLREASLALREKIKSGESENDLLPQAFALVREVSRRTLNQRHFDSQLIGGVVLHEGKIAEMLTGEGKTLAATLATYLNSLSEKGVHVVTVNDYLARRDAVWMGQIYHALGLKIACLVHDSAYIYDPSYVPEEESGELDKERDELGSFKIVEKFLRPITRGEAYLADITYGTNHEFGFDFLRDNLVMNLNDRVQREPNYVIIDEIDSILIDEARTPLIISAPDKQSSEYYKTLTRIVENLEIENDFVVDEKLRIVNITEPGIEKVEKALGVSNMFSPENSRLVHFLQESLKAKALFQLDKNYVVKNNEIIIVDEFTGRLLPGRRYSGGLHQAIEAKEGVAVKEESRTYAQVTIQNYFRLYKKIAGMTGTAQTSAEEFHKVYNLDVVSVPTNRPMVRESLPDVVYKTKKAKYKAIADEVKVRHEKGQPILLGTTSISNNEILSVFLKDAGVPHEVLNAKNNEREGAIIAQAGKVGAVTVATNMAGRGVDIILGGNPPEDSETQKVKDVGGLHVIGTERHEARRIDNQLQGRSGRQGDPGSNQFFLSLEDDLLRIFGGERIGGLMQSLKFPEDIPIESKMISKAVNQAQAKVEGANLDARRHLLDFDDVLNKQRTAIYKKRLDSLEAGKKNEIKPILQKMLSHFVDVAEESIKNQVSAGTAKKEDEEKVKGFREKLKTIPESIELERSIIISQQLVRILDTLWVGHLENLEALRESVNIRAYAQHEPLVEYRREAHKLFQELNLNFESVSFNTVFEIFSIDIERIKNHQRAAAAPPPPPEAKKLGRNDPCYCGSGKKYKKCHGK